MGHRRVFARIARVDDGLLAVNVIFLGVVAAIPFPTDVVGRFGDETPAVVLYAALIGVAALGSSTLFSDARHRHLLEPGTPADAGRIIAARSLSVSVAFLASIPVAFWSPGAAHYVWNAALPIRSVGIAAVRRLR
jgi:uncharacterized membrane protein